MNLAEMAQERLTPRIHMAGESRASRHHPNEDRFFFDEKLGLAIVCDGMSPYKGALSSETAVNAIRSYIEYTTSDLKLKPQQTAFALKRSLYYTNTILHREVPGGGTTAEVFWIRGNNLAYAHSGDGGVGLYSNGQIRYLTQDQTYLRMSHEAGIVDENNYKAICEILQTEENPMFHPLVQKFNRFIKPTLYGGIGVAEDNPWIDSGTHVLQPGDLIFAVSDGVKRTMVKRKIAKIFNNTDSLDKKAAFLLDEVQNLTSDRRDDDITVVLAKAA